MRWPSCNSPDTRVKDSPPTGESAVVRGGGACMACNFRSAAVERVQLRERPVIKGNGRRVSFDGAKPGRSLQSSLRKRPVDPGRVEKVFRAIVRQVQSGGEAEI